MSTLDAKPPVEIDLGPESSFNDLPAPVSIGDDDFFLAQDKEGVYRLLSDICPHSWGQIVRWDNCFMCPSHGWRFEMDEGICINGPRAQMYAFPVAVRDGHLYASVPEDKRLW